MKNYDRGVLNYSKLLVLMQLNTVVSGPRIPGVIGDQGSRESE